LKILNQKINRVDYRFLQVSNRKKKKLCLFDLDKKLLIESNNLKNFNTSSWFMKLVRNIDPSAQIFAARDLFFDLECSSFTVAR
jgi:hypothetical protein